MDEKERLLYLTTKQFNLTEDEAKTLLLEGEDLKENAVDLLLEKDKERIQKLKDERTIRYNEGFQTAEKKFKSHSEDTFKKLTGYSGAEDNFEAMFTAWHKEETKKLAQKKEVTEDDIKRHPLFVKLETETIPKTKYDELQTAFDEFKTKQQREQVMGVVRQRAWDVVAAKEPLLEQNETVAANRRRDFLAKFAGYDYDLQDSKIIVLKDGKRLEDEHGNLLPFEAFASNLSNQYFEFRAQSEKGNAGNKAGGNGGVVITDKPTTAREYATALDKWNGSSDEHAKMRIALKKFYHENKKD
jgi:hypothetical protein